MNQMQAQAQAQAGATGSHDNSPCGPLALQLSCQQPVRELAKMEPHRSSCDIRIAGIGQRDSRMAQISFSLSATAAAAHFWFLIILISDRLSPIMSVVAGGEQPTQKAALQRVACLELDPQTPAPFHTRNGSDSFGDERFSSSSTEREIKCEIGLKSKLTD